MDPLLYQTAAHTPSDQLPRLYQLATSPGAPQALARRMHMGLVLIAVLLLGAGLIFWIAANWQEQSRMFKLGLLEGVLALCVLAACLGPRTRVPGLLAANLALGGLLALIGQTYQTGADAWQLFAVWAGLSLLWTAVARSDVLWTLWVLVATTALLMWQGALSAWWDWADTESVPTAALLRDMLLWIPVAVLPGLVSLTPGLRLPQGLGLWSHRLAMGLALTMWVLHTFAWIPALILAAALLVAAVMCCALLGPWKDFSVLCLATLAANIVVLRVVGQWLSTAMLSGNHLEGFLFSIALVGLLCLGGSVMGLTRAHRHFFLPAHTESPST